MLKVTLDHLSVLSKGSLTLPSKYNGGFLCKPSPCPSQREGKQVLDKVTHD